MATIRRSRNHVVCAVSSGKETGPSRVKVPFLHQHMSSAPNFSRGVQSGLSAFWYAWLLRGGKRTFSPFHRGVVTTYTLEVGAAGDGDNRDHSFSALRAARCSIHGIPPDFSPLTRNWNFCSPRLHAKLNKESVHSAPGCLAIELVGLVLVPKSARAYW
jgi:hypothetical protein